MGIYCLMGMEFRLRKMKRLMRWMMVMVAQKYGYAKMVYFVIYIGCPTTSVPIIISFVNSFIITS